MVQAKSNVITHFMLSPRAADWAFILSYGVPVHEGLSGAWLEPKGGERSGPARAQPLSSGPNDRSMAESSALNTFVPVETRRSYCGNPTNTAFVTGVFNKFVTVAGISPAASNSAGGPKPRSSALDE
jgi:hypothetical protein